MSIEHEVTYDIVQLTQNVNKQLTFSKNNKEKVTYLILYMKRMDDTSEDHGENALKRDSNVGLVT